MMDVLKWVPLLILVVLILILLIGNIVIVQQSKAYVVERLGAFRHRVGRGTALQGALCGAGGQEGVPEGAGGGFRRPSPSSPRTMSPCRSIR